jgi:hypothetical protein
VGEVVPGGELDVRLAGLKRLYIRVDRDELDALEPGVHHA